MEMPAFFAAPQRLNPAYHVGMSCLLEVHGLTVELPTPGGWLRPVNDVSVRIAAGQTLGLVGESGSGKTMLSLALMGLLPEGARVSGEAWLESAAQPKNGVAPSGGSAEKVPAHKNLVGLGESEWQKVRGGEIAMVFQEPMTSLNPVMTIGAQVAEAIRAHDPRVPKITAQQRAIAVLRRASVPEPEQRAKQFPHQLSGGLRQRAMIAMALGAGSRLLIADEPTTALDVTVQKQVLALLDQLRCEMRLGMLFITHDLAVVGQVADFVAVMYAGRIVEQGPVREVLTNPRHPYTQRLLDASPTLERGNLEPIPGKVPALTDLPPGCAFAPRCTLRREDCDAQVPALFPVHSEKQGAKADAAVGSGAASEGHAARCVLVAEDAKPEQAVVQ
jgi:oligopeptide/dipeptide ABC transporter ATP-binding protein